MKISMNRKKSGAILLPLIVALFFTFTLNSCKDEPEPEPPPTVYGSAEVNGSFTTYTRYTFKKFNLPGGVVRNEIALSRSDNSQIVVSFLGSEAGNFDLPNADSLNYCAYIDPGDREFLADSGGFIIDNYVIQDGVISADGFFAFRGKYVSLNTGLTSEVEVASGTFIRLTAE